MAPTTEPPQRPPQPQHPLHDEGDGSDNRRTPATETQQTSNSPDIPVGRASGGGFDLLDGPSVGEMLTGSKPPSALKHQTTTSPEPGGSEVGNFSETLLQNSNPATVASASLRHQSSLGRDRKGGGGSGCDGSGGSGEGHGGGDGSSRGSSGDEGGGPADGGWAAWRHSQLHMRPGDVWGLHQAKSSRGNRA